MNCRAAYQPGTRFPFSSGNMNFGSRNVLNAKHIDRVRGEGILGESIRCKGTKAALVFAVLFSPLVLATTEVSSDSYNPKVIVTTEKLAAGDSSGESEIQALASIADSVGWGAVRDGHQGNVLAQKPGHAPVQSIDDSNDGAGQFPYALMLVLAALVSLVPVSRRR